VVFEGHAIQMLHDDEGMIHVPPNLMDVQMFAWLKAEAARASRRSRSSASGSSRLSQGEISGLPIVEFGVFGFVNDTHPTAPQFLDDAVMRDGLTDHG